MQVEIWSDVVCPWCYLGKRRFQIALDGFPHKDDVEVIWRSFQLDPSVPPGRIEPVNDWLMKKLGVGPARLRAMHDHLEALAREVGLPMNLGGTLTAHTIDAHRMLHLARARGVGDAAHERLFRAHFVENKPIADRATLVALLAEAGVPEDVSVPALEQGAYAKEVEAEIADAHALGIHGVPCFVFDRQLAVSGAQDPEVMREALDEAWARRG